MIRRAGPDDAEAVVRIFRESRAGAMPWLPVLHAPEEDLRHFSRQFRAEAAYVFELDGRVVGFAVVKGDELDALYVAPEAQGRSVGSALFEQTQDVRPDGFRLWVFRDNVRARRFYEARGCRLIRETDGLVNEERMPDALYEWAPSAAAEA